MHMPGSFPYVPLWLLTLIFFAALIAARELGAFLRTRHTRRNAQKPASSNADAGEGDSFSTNTVMGLLALLIGFTFSLALGRYDDRRTLVLQEANALGTTWLRTDLLDTADAERVRAVLRRYIDARVDFANAKTAQQEVNEYARTTALQTELWVAVMAATAPFRDTPRASLMITTTNESIDLAGERFAARQNHIPHRILRMLLLFSLFAAGLLGYERHRQRSSSTLLLLLFSLAVGLVLDLDLPSTGGVSVPQNPMLDLQRSVALPTP
ncbi:TPA: hypothetical protein QDZ10_001794 [Stenotrophomonas maltophilia]|nr:hypothetical protein [Stenotrophomonas maltophilia]